MIARTLATFALANVLAFSSATPALGLTRLEIVARGRGWVTREVPYSQSSTTDGYRQDCSGMASMMWRLSFPGPSTRELARYGTPITRDELQPGDLMLKYDYHAAMFCRWANAEHTSYWTLEESSSAGRAVERLTPYPYWSVEGFSAYRLNTITEVDDYDAYITPVEGTDRFQTAFAASRKAFANGSAPKVIVCSGANWPDALGGSSLAGSVDGPVLLTGANTVPTGLQAELARLGTRSVTVIGGPSAVSTSVVDAIAAMPGISNVTRIGGKDRYATAALVAEETIRVRTEASLRVDGGVFIATGAAFPDALGAAASAAHSGRPILLAHVSGLPTVTVDALGAIDANRAVIAGGTSALGSGVETDLRAAGIDGSRIARFAGKDRYETSLLLAEHGVALGLRWKGLGLATGTGFADALSGAVMQARLGSVLVLTPSGHLDPSSDAAVREHLDVVERVTVLGGEAAVSRLARRQVRWIIAEP